MPRFIILAALLSSPLLFADVNIDDIRAKANAGDSAAQCNLGVIYEEGDNVTKDSVEAIKWFRKAADQGYAEAQSKLGWMYDNGEGVKKDSTEAVKWFRMAADQGFAKAQYNLGIEYEYGNGVTKNDTESAKWFRKAADQGDVDAQFNIGWMYENGDGVGKDHAEAVKWYRLAAEQGYVRAQTKLGWMYGTADGVPRDLAEAIKWYRKAADQNDIEAEFWLGVIYSHGNGVPKNNTEAAKWYRKASDQGDAAAQDNLAWMYYNGEGVVKDSIEAVKWFRMAADQGYLDSQYNLGRMYAVGDGIPKDDIEAYKWLNLAAAQGVTYAVKGRDGLATEMTSEQIAQAQAESSSFVAHREAPEATSKQNPTNIFGEGTPPVKTGTGFFITDDGYFLTCYHVVQGAQQVKLKTNQDTFAATVIKVDSTNDVALLKVNGAFHSLPVASSVGVKLADSLFTIGFPEPEMQGLSQKYTAGEISSLNGMQDDPTEFQISVPVQPGNSGGPLVNRDGNVVGIIEARLPDIAAFDAYGSLPQNVNYATKSSILTTLLESVPEISSKLKTPNTSTNAKPDEVVKQVEQSVALVLVY